MDFAQAVTPPGFIRVTRTGTNLAAVSPWTRDTAEASRIDGESLRLDGPDVVGAFRRPRLGVVEFGGAGGFLVAAEDPPRVFDLRWCTDWTQRDSNHFDAIDGKTRIRRVVAFVEAELRNSIG